MNSAEVNASIQIAKPANEVFEAIVDPAEMTNYFISKSSGRMESGAQLLWEFPEFKGENSVRVGEIVPGNLIGFYWDVDGVETYTEIKMTAVNNNSTVVRISEKGNQPDVVKSLKFIKGNTEGWANFLACLKAWLEHGINLRKGAFDFFMECH